MATSVTISNAPNVPNGGKLMMVDFGIIEVDTNADAIITFNNSLASPAKAVGISFFPADTAAEDKTDTTNAIAGFCTEMNGGKVLTVATGSGNCTIANSMVGKSYLYTLSADPPYIDLDPVIIVEGGGVTPQFSPGPLIIGLAAVAALAIGVIAYRMGYAAGKK